MIGVAYVAAHHSCNRRLGSFAIGVRMLMLGQPKTSLKCEKGDLSRPPNPWTQKDEM